MMMNWNLDGTNHWNILRNKHCKVSVKMCQRIGVSQSESVHLNIYIYMGMKWNERLS